MRKSSVPGKRKYEGFSWISVDEEDHSELFRTTQRNTRESLFSQNLQTFDLVAEQVQDLLIESAPLSPSNHQIKKGSLIPRSSNFVAYNSNKYYCPYYIKPQLWEKINSAPRYNEKLEMEKVNNFYNFMHIGDVNPNPLTSNKKVQQRKYSSVSRQLADLPSIHKYKT